MSNPFKDWTMQQVAAHNAKVSSVASVLEPEAPASVPSKPAVNFEVRPSSDEQKLNKTERAYLQALRRDGHPWIGIQNITLKLADDTRLTPDFTYIENGAFVFVDVKGFQREDALIKMKVAARQFPWAQFRIVKREGAGWDARDVRP